MTPAEAIITDGLGAGSESGHAPRAPRRVPGYAVRLVGGDRGAVPVLVGLAVIWTVFQAANPQFLSPVNLTNLMLQITTLVVISVGVVLVLLLGEIDLSVGAVSGLCAGVMAVLNAKHGVPAVVALSAGALAGATIGTLHGLWVTRFRVPSFVVTLAGLLAWQGALLYVLGDTGTVNITDPAILRLTGTFLPETLGWAVAAFVALGRGAMLVLQRRRRAAAGLPVPAWSVLALPVAGTGGVAFGAVSIFNADRGLPLAVILFVGLVVAADYLVTRTRFGRHLLAIGGNAEAARRSGIPVGRIRVEVFVLASMLAAAGGILGAARLQAVNQSSGSGDLLLNVIAAAVIGGTSLFGGRGSAWSALLGALVIGSTSNGMDLLAVPSSVKFMVTGAVLLVAATVDASSRRRRITRGQT